MTIGEIASDIGQVWGFPSFTNIPAFGKERIRIEINKTIQEIQDAGEDFYGREDVEITLSAGTGSYVLEQEVQTVLDPVVLQDGTQLRKLTSNSQANQFGQIFLSRPANDVPDGKPSAYFVDAMKADDDDNVQIVFQLLPAPSVANATSVIVPVIKEAALFSGQELTVGTASLPIPHKYIESIFLPIARYNASTCFLFYKKESVAKYEDDYVRALKLLGKADPRQPKPADSNTAALEITKQPRAQQPQ